ncbi:MAG: type I polyketide synthase [Gammaproteobacteria bacterium]|nr:type I polyketide synthase [Gammaproteobacteria bacterium]
MKDIKRQIAVIGHSFRFPGQDDANFWQNLLDGKDLVTKVDPERWAMETYHHPNKKQPGKSYTFSAGSIGDAAAFDAHFFGISPREASSMDPQQRLLLELSWEALENAGIKPSSVRSSNSSVYIGIASSDYSYRLTDDIAAIDSSFATGNTASIAANRISYVFDFRGPSMAIDTACSSSMVAFHQACRSIEAGESSMALAGGVSLHLHPSGFVGFSKASMLSKQGRCKVFDASGDGYVRSEGGGILILKDYNQAVADGNPILAIVAASAINTDGHKSSITIPSSEAQAALLKQTYSQAGIHPESIDYIEAHGTGTAVGDPIETKAIYQGLSKNRPKSSPLPIGSIKSNLGHLEAASGIAGLIKALHCIKHRTIPATIGLKSPNTNIKFDDWNLEVVTNNLPLDKNNTITIGINSFGFGGANAHVILQSYDTDKEERPPQNTIPPLIMSAKSSEGLKDVANNYSTLLQHRKHDDYYNIAYSAAYHRDWHEYRTIITGESVEAITENLAQFAKDPDTTNSSCASVTMQSASQGPAFIYSGNGSQWFSMGKLLLEDPVFLDSIREVDTLFQKLADYSLEAELAGNNGKGRLEKTEIAQPALFALQVGITNMLRQNGIQPTAVAGHSVGEVAAAWAAGILSLADATQVIYHRSKLQGSTKGHGQMTAIAMGEAEIKSLLVETGHTKSLVIAGINSSRGVTIAGNSDSLSCLESTLSERNIPHKRLDLDYAFHSPAMNGIQDGIKTSLSSILPITGKTAYFSAVTGSRLDGSELNHDYWWHNIRQPVLFEQAIKSLLKQGDNIFIEVGPHTVLSGYINECLKDTDINGQVIGTISRNEGQPWKVWSASNQAIIAGANIDWKRFFPSTGNFAPIPNYPWQRERYWIHHTSESLGLLERHNAHPLLGYPLQQHELTWENQLDSQRHPMLADHVVGGSTVFPGTGFAELALAAAQLWQPQEKILDIEELEIISPLLLDDQVSNVTRLHIDPQDGSFTINSREHTSTEPWTPHVKGRILIEPQGLLLQIDTPSVPTRKPDYHSTEHEDLTRTSGLDYGPAFRCIDYGWIEGKSTLAILKIPDEISSDLEQMHLHPAILDCTFQLIIQLLRDEIGQHQGMVFVPTKIGKIVSQSESGQPHLVRATMLRRTPHSLTAEFTLFDKDNQVIAVIKEARFRGVRLEKETATNLSLLNYHSIPKPHPYRTTAVSVNFNTIQYEMSEIVKRNLMLDSNHRYTEEVEPLLDSLCSQFTIEAFQQLAEDGKCLTYKTIENCRKNTPAATPYLDHLINQAEQDQIISSHDNHWQIHFDMESQASSKDIWNILIADYPDHFPIINMVGRIGSNLKSILNGEQTLLDLNLANISLAIPITQVLGPDRRQRVGQVIRELITQGLSQLPEGRRMSMLEVSQETPLFAIDACQTMDFNRCNYTFATNSPAALEEADRLKEHFPNFHSQLIEQELKQDKLLPANLYQFIIVTLDFIEASQSLLALNFARSQLAPGGTLLLISQHPARWVDFAFGAHPGWFQETESGLLSNQTSVKYWQQQLLQLGLTAGEPIEFSPGNLTDIIFLASHREEADVVPAPQAEKRGRNWIILADNTNVESSFVTQLSAQLQSIGDQVHLSVTNEINDYADLIMKVMGSGGSLDGIIHLAGLDSSTTNIQATECVEQQAGRCTILANLVRACKLTDINTTYWILTTGAATALLPDNKHSQRLPRTTTPADSVLWGFSRSLTNEVSNYNVRIIDIESLSDENTIITALLREFEQADHEQEVILSNTGERFVPRLRFEPIIPLPDKEPENRKASTAEANIRLGFKFPGQLRNLQWESVPSTQLNDDEVEIEVHATGLNFRDLMYTLGLLSDEAVEKGFAGPSLGLEFAGTVLNTGPNTSNFNPGDKVVGFGPSCFSNRVTTKAAAISHIPPSLSFEAAATIPSVFFTVYYSLHHLAQLQEGEEVLIHGAAGGIGIAAIQLAKAMGAKVYATAGSNEKRDFLRLIGADYIYDSRSLSFAEEILEQTNGRGVDVVLNSLAGEAINRNFQVLKPFGRFLELGKRDFYENTKIGLRPFRNNISYFGIDADQLMQERPDLTNSLFSKVMELFAADKLHPLPYHTFEAEYIIDAFRYMQQARHIGKIVVTYRNGIAHDTRPIQSKINKLALSADGTYLITGGLAGFGLKTAEWLAEKGARHLVLISRSGPKSDEAKKSIECLEQQGVSILAESCDVTDENALSKLLEKINTTHPPLRGIVHAAVVIDDGLIQNMDKEQIQRVLEPKILGAHHLHRLTLDQQLEFFILFSSATTMFGNPGQASYVAANSWLEALAHHRHTMGLPATSVCWGAIDDVGFLARNEEIKDALQNRMGGSAINSASALEMLENLLMTERSGHGVMELDWNALSRFLPSAGTPKFDEIARSTEGKEHDHDGIETIQRLLHELPDNELLELFIEIIANELGEILRISPEKIDPRRSIYDMGLDSLMGVELAVAIEARFGARLSVMALKDSITVSKLADTILAKLKGADDSETSDDPTNNTLDQIQQLANQHSLDGNSDQANELATQIKNNVTQITTVSK